MTETKLIKQEMHGVRVYMIGAFKMLSEDWMQEKEHQEVHKDNNKKK